MTAEKPSKVVTRDGEKRIPIHGDENPSNFLIIRIVIIRSEKRIPIHGDENFSAVILDTSLHLER